jgi:signal transduction histidine kinase
MATHAAATGSARREDRRRYEQALDLGLALLVFGLSVAVLAGISEDEPGKNLDATSIVLLAVASLPLAAHRRAPLGVFVVAAAASSVLVALGYPPGPPLAAAVALFFVGLHPAETRTGLRLTATVVLVLFAAHVAGVAIGHEGEFPLVGPMLGVILWGGAWVLGDRVRMRRERIAELEERLRRAEREAERERRLAAAEERTRIARDLHDSAGHAINVILVQAGAARLLSEQDPAEARAALATIEEVARETVGEIDRLVRVLREDASDGDPVDPPGGLAGLPTLVERVRATGLDVTVEELGDRRPLEPAVDQAAYRILQEALTNAAQHGDGPAQVEVAFDPDALTLTVVNPSSGEASPAAPGHGLVGMRERAVLLGGTFTAGPEDEGFAVRVRLPLQAEVET